MSQPVAHPTDSASRLYPSRWLVLNLSIPIFSGWFCPSANNEADREHFVELLAQWPERFGTVLHAYV